MKKIIFLLFIILSISCSESYAQDKLFFRNGTFLFCKITAISETTISYKDTLGNPFETNVSKAQLMLLELKTGEVYIFGSDSKTGDPLNSFSESKLQRKERKMNDWKKQEDTLSNNILGFYFPVILFGRLGISYERLFANKSMGIKIPLILSYDPSGLFSISRSNSNQNSTRPRNTGVNFITGIDLNFYHDIKPKLKYYFGPRIRYGTDMSLGGVEGLTVQIQNGIFRSSGKRLTNTFGVGFGFAKISNVRGRTRTIFENQVYPSFSVTWRLGFRL